MKQSLHWKVKNLSSPSAFDLPLGASVLIVPALSSSSSSTSSSSSISCSLQSQVKCIAYPPTSPFPLSTRYVYASPCLPTYPVPFSDVSLVAALQRMSTFYCHPTTIAPPPSLPSSRNPLHQLGDPFLSLSLLLLSLIVTTTSLSLATYSFPTTANSFAYTL